MTEKPTTRQLAGVFIFYFVAQLLFAPAAIQLIHRFATGSWSGAVTWAMNPSYRPYWNLLIVAITGLTIGAYALILERDSLKSIWGKFTLSLSLFFKMYGYWFLAYPLVLIVSHLMQWALSFWVVVPETDQIAVDQVRSVFAYPTLYFFTALMIVTVVPMIEEILFRGYLQQWLKNFFSPFWCVAISGFIFSFFHYATDQGWMNVVLILALFTFSLFLGYVRERYQTLNASIMLHAIFNAMSIIQLTVEELFK